MAECLHSVRVCDASRKLSKLNPKVVIIGAGIAGIAAGNQLASHGITDFKILEATNRTGGRICSISVAEGSDDDKVELGANWIHGIDQNPIYQIADGHDLLKLQNRRNLREKVLCITETGNVLSLKTVRELDWEYGKLMQQTEQFFQLGLPTALEDDSVGEFLNREMDHYLGRFTGKDRHYRQLLFENRKSMETCISGCHSMNEVSLSEIGSYEELPGIHYTIPPGFESVLEILKTEIPPENIVLNCPVRRICYDHDEVCIECKNGDKYLTDFVIVTVSLGYLKDNYSTLFYPSLPHSKLSAIKNLAFGTVDKIILEFDRAIVDADVRQIQCLWDRKELSSKSDMSENWYKKIYSFDVVHENVLMVWLSGKEAQYMESLSDEEIGRVCVNALHTFLPRSNIPMPKKIIKTRWYTNPYQKGSYSFIPVGACVDDIDNLMEPLKNEAGKPLVMFAGEATHSSFYSTTHGALLSGRREADRVLGYRHGSDHRVHGYYSSPTDDSMDEQQFTNSSSPTQANGFSF